jgi:hypothetical protein
MPPKTHAASPIRRPPAVPPVYQPRNVPSVAQAKRPTAPRVYRPQPTRGVVLAKTGIASQPLKPPVPPPVYRPTGTPRVVQRVSLGELKTATGADKKFAADYDLWIANKLKVTGLAQDKIIEKFSLQQLKDSASEYAVHHRNLDVIVNPIWKDAPLLSGLVTNKIEYAKTLISEYYTDEVVKALLKSPTLIKAAGPKLSGGANQIRKDFGAAIKVADLETFDKIRLQEAHERALAIPDELIRMDFSTGMRIGEQFYLRLGSGTPGKSLHVPIHEFMHSLSSVIMKTALGSTLNEGLTERIALIVMQEAGDPCDRPAYVNERQDVDKMIVFLIGKGFSADDLYSAYFNTGIMGGAAAGLLPAIERFRELSSLDAAAIKERCQQKGIAFNDDKWTTSHAYRDAKMKQLADADASRTLWGLIRQVARGGESYTQLQHLSPSAGF